MSPEYEKKCADVYRKFCADHADIKAIGYRIDASSPSYLIISTTIGEIRLHVDADWYHMEGGVEKQKKNEVKYTKWDTGMLPIVLVISGFASLIFAAMMDHSILLVSGAVIFAAFCSAAPILASLRRIEQRLDDIREKGRNNQ